MSDNRLSGHALGLLLCDVFGLDPARTQDIALHASVDGAAQLDVKMFVLGSQGERLGVELRRFTLQGDDILDVTTFGGDRQTITT